MFLCTITLDATHDGQNAAAMSSIYVEVEVSLFFLPMYCKITVDVGSLSLYMCIMHIHHFHFKRMIRIISLIKLGFK